MEDEELTALKDLRKKLLMRVCTLTDTLKKQEENQQVVVLKDEPCTLKNISSMRKKVGKYEHRLCEITKRMSGITFENIDRKWIKNNIYQYTAALVTKALTFHIELLVKLEEEEEFEIHSIKCDYVNINKCYVLEIDPWIQTMIKMKNFSFLTTVISHYTEQSMIRKTVVDNLTAEKYITSKPCMNDNGGIIICVHSPENVQQMYLKIQWTILFLERNWKHEHHFIISTLEAGCDFAKQNLELLEEFCQIEHTKRNLFNLWRRLCSAIDLYEGRDYN